MPVQGYITSATGHIKHLQMAVDLRLSLRKWDPKRPFAVIVNESISSKAKDFAVFDRVHVVPDAEGRGYGGKLYTAEASPYAQTLFFDADCLAVGPVESLWEHLQHLHFCVPGQYVAADCHGHHHNHQISDLCAQFDLSHYYWAISPMYFFSDIGRSTVQEVQRVYHEELTPRGICQWDTDYPPDEIAFGVVGGRANFASFPPVQTIIKQRNLSEWTLGNPPHPIFHCTMSPTLDVLAGLMQEVAARRRAAGLPQGSRRYWVKKALQKKTQRDITQALGLPWRNPFRNFSPKR